MNNNFQRMPTTIQMLNQKQILFQQSQILVFLIAVAHWQILSLSTQVMCQVVIVAGPVMLREGEHYLVSKSQVEKRVGKDIFIYKAKIQFFGVIGPFKVSSNFFFTN